MSLDVRKENNIEKAQLGVLQGRAPEDVVFWSRRRRLAPPAAVGAFLALGTAATFPLSPPAWELLAQPHRSEMRVANAASLARMLQDRAEPRRLFRSAFMAMILQMLRTWGETRERRGRISVTRFS